MPEFNGSDERGISFKIPKDTKLEPVWGGKIGQIVLLYAPSEYLEERYRETKEGELVRK